MGSSAENFTYASNSNQPATYKSITVLHDGMGNVTDDGDGRVSEYDRGGRLSLLSRFQTNNQLQLHYNGLGELARTRKVTWEACTGNEILLSTEYFSFAPDGRAMALVSENQGRTETEYLWLDDLPVAQFQDSYDAAGTYQGTTSTYLHADHLGTPRVGTDQNKQISWRWTGTDAFGLGTASGTASVRLRFPGQITLGLAGVNYNYYRDYLPQWGRYRESDPIGLEGGLNTYGYVLNNPLRWTDRLGLLPFEGCPDADDCKFRPYTEGPEGIVERKLYEDWAETWRFSVTLPAGDFEISPDLPGPDDVTGRPRRPRPDPIDVRLRTQLLERWGGDIFDVIQRFVPGFCECYSCEDGHYKIHGRRQYLPNDRRFNSTWSDQRLTQQD